MIITLIFAFALAIVAAIFALQNPVMVEANFFGYLVQGSLALFVLIGLGVGLLIGVLVMTPGRIKSSLANNRHRRKIVELESSIQQIRSTPPVYSAPPAEQKTIAPDVDDEYKSTP
jgi:uncharacterized membrane protein YciS (DUF1049 family)